MFTEELSLPIHAEWRVAGDRTQTLWWPVRTDTTDAEGVRTVLFFICGNPGVIDYYIPFLDTVHNLSHLGHTTATGDIPPEKRTLDAQIQHKIDCFDLLRTRFPANTRFVLVGHSVGTYISLQVLQARPSHGIARVICLFPTLCNILDTPNGRTMHVSSQGGQGGIGTGSVRYRGPAPRISFAVARRRCVGASLLHAVLHRRQCPITPVVGRNCLVMSRHEMAEIKELQADLIEKHLDKLIFYYGVGDGWSPVEHYKDLISRFPQGGVTSYLLLLTMANSGHTVRHHHCSVGCNSARLFMQAGVAACICARWVE
ncbi:hypothetical protein THASP1DRAFT_19419 [Thamnocephalis sphaerospora]|uniref:Alpha/Beta hydrolase protein n=1 Tax=Thamnocephalis sphaerospora TaxID=78915 RepID=A0A4P9XJ36_9FUNG|nr:hypothetical protein THASP1DRAFT_19419 [Thamnocephalis sphaerospora]|eukprot:RKP05738.1 hypothetical protein THASP1DRAFT_19419 [Thamnocephalis sphaerospora]